mmetsp:Transcript_113940/g.318327  ORF Transcript_113940/g.318327 Transcript_113940/m.318327 type:complete len:200 (-) Transcript_113940:1702-2301(-)
MLGLSGRALRVAQTDAVLQLPLRGAEAATPHRRGRSIDLLGHSVRMARATGAVPARRVLPFRALEGRGVVPPGQVQDEGVQWQGLQKSDLLLRTWRRRAPDCRAPPLLPSRARCRSRPATDRVGRRALRDRGGARTHRLDDLQGVSLQGRSELAARPEGVHLLPQPPRPEAGAGQLRRRAVPRELRCGGHDSEFEVLAW